MPEKLDPNLDLSYGWNEGEDGWAPGMDKNMTRLGAFVGLEVIDADLSAPPGSPTEGDRYIVGPTATGAWAGQEDAIAVYLEAAWTFHAPSQGLRAFVGPDLVMSRWDDGAGVWMRGEQRVRMIDAAGALQGALFQVTDGIALARSVDGTYDPNDGAVSMTDGRLELFGSQVDLPNMTHSVTGGLPVYADTGGQLFLGPAPPNLWKQETTDVTDYTTLGAGLGTGPWVEMTGMAITLAQNIEIGHELLVSVTLQIHNVSGTRAGKIEAFFGVAGLGDPGAVTPQFTYLVAGGQDGLSTQAVVQVATLQWLAASDVGIYARRADGEQAAYEPQLLGSVAPHVHVIQRTV